MQITKKEDSVLVELSQAELSAIRLMAEMASESASSIPLIDPAVDPGPYHATENLYFCSAFLRRIGEHAERPCAPHKFHEIGHEFYALFMPEAIGEPSPLE